MRGLKLHKKSLSKDIFLCLLTWNENMKNDMAALNKHNKNPEDDGAAISFTMLGKKATIVAPVHIRSKY